MNVKSDDTPLDILRLRCMNIIRRYRKENKWFASVYYSSMQKPLSQQVCEKVLEVYKEIKDKPVANWNNPEKI